MCADVNHDYIYQVTVNQFKIVYEKGDKHYLLGGLVDTYLSCVCTAVPKCLLSSNDESEKILLEELQKGFTSFDKVCNEYHAYNPTDNNFSFAKLKK